MKYGPISAAISATMKAIASPSSVVCTVSPLEQAPAHSACAAWRVAFALALRAVAMTIRKRPPAAALKISAGATLYIEPTVAKSQQRRVTSSHWDAITSLRAAC
jgi:hypothetical protein